VKRWVQREEKDRGGVDRGRNKSLIKTLMKGGFRHVMGEGAQETQVKRGNNGSDAQESSITTFLYNITKTPTYALIKYPRGGIVIKRKREL